MSSFNYHSFNLNRFCSGNQLECLQCTSLVQRVGEVWNYSCLDGTLEPLPCTDPDHALDSPYKTCISALFRISNQRKGGKKTIEKVDKNRCCLFLRRRRSSAER